VSVAAPHAPAAPTGRGAAIAAGLLYALALSLYLLPFSSWVGVVSAIGAGWLGLRAAVVARQRQLRLAVAIGLGLAVAVGGVLLGDRALESRLVPNLLGVGGSFALAEVLTFGLAAGGLIFVLRTLSCAVRSLSLLEVLFVAGSTVTILADHRNRMLNRPRVLSDWAWSLGVDPASVLLVVGILASVAAIFLFLRGQTTLKLVSTAVLLLLLGALFFLLKDKRIDMQTPVDPLGLSGKGSGTGSGSGSGGGGGGGAGPRTTPSRTTTPRRSSRARSRSRCCATTSPRPPSCSTSASSRSRATTATTSSPAPRGGTPT
jgi:hypothetical protein